jgi:hypothetical protein
VKKLTVILLLIIYGANVSGMTLHFHYCCGKLKSIDLNAATKNCFGLMDHNMSKKKCCDNKQLTISIKTDQKPVNALQLPFSSVAVKSYSPLFQITAPISTARLIPEVFAPPPLQKDLNTFYCIFRI